MTTLSTIRVHLRACLNQINAARLDVMLYATWLANYAKDLAMSVVIRHYSACPCFFTALWCCTQGSQKASLSGVSNISAEAKPVVQQSGAEDTLSNMQRLTGSCIVICDSDEESLDTVGRTRSISSDDRDQGSSEGMDPQEHTDSISNDAAAMLPAQPTGQISSRKINTTHILTVNHAVSTCCMQCLTTIEVRANSFCVPRSPFISSLTTSAGEQCVVCRERASVTDLNQCGSCDKLLHEECAASLPAPLSLYCFFCKDCEKQPHQRGALLEVQDTQHNPL